MKSVSTQHALLLAVGLAATIPASAAIIAYEGFDYTAGTLMGTNGAASGSTGLNGGTGWSNAWTVSGANINTPWAANATGLSYTDGTNTLQTSGGSMFDSTATGDTNRWRRNFAIPGGNWGTSSTWFSFLTDRTDTATGTTQEWNFRLQAGTTTIAQIKNIAGATDGWDLLNSGGVSQGTLTSVSEVAPVFVVGRITQNGGAGNDLLELWFNPNLSSLGTSSLSATFANFSTLDGFSFQTGSSTTGRVDEIRFGTTFAAVAPIPEPSAFAALAGLGALGFVASRRRRRG